MEFAELSDTQKQKVKAFKMAVRDGDAVTVLAIAERFPEIIDLQSPLPPWMCLGATYGQLEVPKVLYGLGADPNLRGRGYEDGKNALSTAAAKGFSETVRYLLELGTKIEIHNSTTNPLLTSVFGRNPEMTRLLLEAGADAPPTYQIRGEHSYDALAFALERGEREIASVIALHLAGGDAAGAQAELDRAWAVVRAVFEGQEGEDPPPPKIEPPYQ